MKHHALILAGMLLIAALITACGQKGDLFLPDEPPASEQTKKRLPDTDYIVSEL